MAPCLANKAAINLCHRR